MPLPLAVWLVRLLAAYCVVGILFAVPFVLRGVRRIDPAAAEGTWGFRVLILPGVVALWPLLLARWWRDGGGPPPERTPHRRRAGGDA